MSELVGDLGENMAQEMKEIRGNVLNIYHGSIYLAFKQYKQSVRMEMNEKMMASHAHDSQTQVKALPKAFGKFADMNKFGQFSDMNNNDELSS